MPILRTPGRRRSRGGRRGRCGPPRLRTPRAPTPRPPPAAGRARASEHGHGRHERGGGPDEQGGQYAQHAPLPKHAPCRTGLHGFFRDCNLLSARGACARCVCAPLQRCRAPRPPRTRIYAHSAGSARSPLGRPAPRAAPTGTADGPAPRPLRPPARRTGPSGLPRTSRTAAARRPRRSWRGGSSWSGSESRSPRPRPREPRPGTRAARGDRGPG